MKDSTKAVLCIILGLAEGILIYIYLPVAIMFIALVPGFVAFFGEAIGNVGKDKNQ